jgi:hypothetical protein
MQFTAAKSDSTSKGILGWNTCNSLYYCGGITRDRFWQWLDAFPAFSKKGIQGGNGTAEH